MNTPIKPPCTNIGTGGRLISPGGIDLTTQGQINMNTYANHASMQTFSRRDIKMPDYSDKEPETETRKPRHPEACIMQPNTDEVHVFIFKMYSLSERDYSFMKKAQATSRGKAVSELAEVGNNLKQNIMRFSNVGGELILCTMSEASYRRYSKENIVVKCKSMTEIINTLGNNMWDRKDYTF